MSDKRIDMAILGSLTYLGDAECGRLLRSALKYSATGEAEELGGNERYVWPVVKGLIDRYLEELNSDATAAKPEFSREEAESLYDRFRNWQVVADIFGISRMTLHRRMRESDVSNDVTNVSDVTSDVTRCNSVTRKNKETPLPPVREEREEKKERSKERKEEIEESLTPNTKEPVLPRTRDSSGMSKKMQADFDSFWASYPRKVGKGAARKAFVKAMAKGVTLDTLIAAVEAQKHCRQWTKDGSDYIPHPSTWLNQERWEDVIEDEQPVSATYRGNQVTVTKDWGIVYDY